MPENYCIKYPFQEVRKKNWKSNSKKVKESNKSTKNEIENKLTVDKMNQTTSQLFEMTSIIFIP